MSKLSQEEKTALKKAGLSTTEQRIYLYLLEFGDQNPTDLAKVLQMQRSNTYAVLKRLVQKKFVVQIKRGKRFVYRAKEPESLMSVFTEQKKMFESVLPQLELLRYRSETKPSVRLFEGIEEIKTIYEESLDAERILGIASTEQLFSLDERYFANYVLALKNKNVFFKDILAIDSAETTAKQMKDVMKGYYEYKILPKSESAFANDILIYGDTVAMVSFANHVHGISIKDIGIRETFEHLFQMLWRNA